ncbi:chromo domain-containing protein [Tieghemostelium lacteum]|uniref:Chromo domain-containing protein n=1 Tax=Tieghemostelium lacteum TaxID=361077 RepID=A0A151Z543_TIELA|nr:chromo domain-containing protein [Tieghemostelium lacteum]|eukprot:KYQ89093.1 chromo domain-containing protein [Tieghemostelium lacteum]
MNNYAAAVTGNVNTQLTPQQLGNLIQQQQQQQLQQTQQPLPVQFNPQLHSYNNMNNNNSNSNGIYNNIPITNSNIPNVYTPQNLNLNTQPQVLLDNLILNNNNNSSSYNSFNNPQSAQSMFLPQSLPSQPLPTSQHMLYHNNNNISSGITSSSINHNIYSTVAQQLPTTVTTPQHLLSPKTTSPPVTSSTNSTTAVVSPLVNNDIDMNNNNNSVNNGIYSADESEDKNENITTEEPYEEMEEIEEEESEGKDESDDDYQSEGSDEDEDNDTFIKKSRQSEKDTQLQTRTTRSGRSQSKMIKFLSDDESEEESEEESSDSDYEPNKRKGKKKSLKKKKKQPARKQRSSKLDMELETLASTVRPTRERRSTVRLYQEIAGVSEDDQSGADQIDNDDDYQEDDENSGDDYQSDTETHDNVHMKNNDDDSEDYQEESDDSATKRKRAKNKKQFSENNTITHLNLRKRNVDFSVFNSEDDEEGEGNEMNIDGGVNTVVQQALVTEAPLDEDTIEKILDHRLKTTIKTEDDSNENGEKVKEDNEGFNVDNYEFLVKWKGWAHIHNTWDTYEHLVNFKGNKKLVNYTRIVIELYTWRQNASREDIEQADIQREMNRQEYQEYLKVERIIAQREVEPSADTKSLTQYLVKWCTLAYADVTWEYPEEISDKYQNEIDNFLIRQQTQQTSKANSISAKKRAEMGFTKLDKQPDYLNAGTLRDYQLEGLNWLIHSWINNTNVILADEMGLGKTIQTISLLSYLNIEQQMPGPFLVVVPLSTIENWQREFAKWAPQLNVVLYTGTSQSRTIIREYEFFCYSKLGKKKINFNILLTTYDFILKDRQHLGALKWDYLAVDEAHRLKNNESALHEVLKLYHTGNRLLVTGTPLQNSLKELWNLLNFLMPNKFHSLKEFQDQYSELKEKEQIAELHRVLKPHLLRRIKKDVEKSLPPKTERILRVDFAPLQKKYYKWILAKNFNELNKGVKGEKTTLLNIVTELKKTCNHPYLFESAVQESSGALEDLIKGSGKLILLDKLLLRLKETGHRVLIFSQMVRMLDILAEYLKKRSFQFQRLDGSMGNDKRNQAMDRFNAPDSPDFCFLLSTRAGGLGINLTTADTVIIFDSDWNPQNDLQAEARAHRIGQKNHVNIYRLVTKNSIEEDILERAKQKMVLDHLVIQTMEKSATASKSSSNVFNKEDLEKILKFGAEDLFKEANDETNQMPEMDIDEILSRAVVTNNDQPTDMNAGQELLNSFRVANFSTSTGKEKEDISWDKIIPDSERQGQSTTEDDPMMLLGTRRSRTEATLGNMPTLSSHEPLTITVKPKKEITFFNKKEIKILIRSLKKYGTHQRAKEILVDANFPTNKPVRATEDICKEIIESCRKAVRDNSDSSDKIHIVYNGTDINAIEMMQRVEDMEVLCDLCKPHMADHQHFRVTFPIRPVSWQVKWGPKEDAMVLMGSYKHGMGNWEAIQQDTSLGLDQIISLSNEDQDPTQKVKGPTLQRRVEALVKSAKDIYKTKKIQSDQEEVNVKKEGDKSSTRLSQRKRVPRTSNTTTTTTTTTTSSGRAVKPTPEKRKLSKYSDDDEDYQDEPHPKKKLKSRTGSSRRQSSGNSTTKSPSRSSGVPPKVKPEVQSPIRTSSGRLSMPPQKLNQSNNTVNSPSKFKQTPNQNSKHSSLMSDEETKSISSSRNTTTPERSRSSSRPSRSTSSTSTHSLSSSIRSSSGSELARKCKHLLNPLLPLLVKFQSLSDETSKKTREEKLTKTKKYLVKLGSSIDSIAEQEKSKKPPGSNEPSLLQALWEHASKYTASEGNELKQLYEKMSSKIETKNK